MNNGINLWLDDKRDPKEFSPHIDWVWVKTAKVAIAALEAGIVKCISLDHDLGPEWETGNGYMVAKYIEEAAYLRKIPQLEWHVHSQNSVGVASMKAALNNANRYWSTPN
jgi:hypothetical protein